MSPRSPKSRFTSVGALVVLILLSSISINHFGATTYVSASLSPNQATAIQQFSLAEWTLPTAGGGPVGIAIDPVGKIWTTENSTAKIARFDPATNDFVEWDVPTGNSGPRNIFAKQVTVSGVNVTQVFFTEYASNKIARFDSSTNNFTEWQLPVGSSPVGIYVDENTDIWFTESGRDIIARLSPSTGNLTEWTLPSATSTPGSPVLKPWGIFVRVVSTAGGTNRFVWFTETLGSKIGRLEANSNRLTLWDLNLLGLGSYQPTEIAPAVLQTLPVVVFASVNSNRISILGNDTGGGSVYEESLVATNSALPAGVTFDSSRNAIWFAETRAGNIANLNTTTILAQQLFTPAYCSISPASGSPACAAPATRTSSILTPAIKPFVSGSPQTSTPTRTTISIYQGPLNGISEYRLPNVTARPTSTVLDSGGNIWFTESNVTVNKIGRLSIPYILQLSSSPSSQTVSRGQSATYAVNVALLGGSPSPVQLSLLNAPSNTSAQFNPQTATPPFSSTLIIGTTSLTPTGTFQMSINASSAGQNQFSTITLTVQIPPPPPPPKFDYLITVTSSTNVTINQGQSASFNLAISLTNGTTQLVNLTAAGLPTGTQFSLTTKSGLPTFTSTLNIQTDFNTPPGSYPITITGASSGTTLHYPAQGPTLVVNPVTRDFNLSTSVSQVTLIQGSRTSLTLTVTSIGPFNGEVALSSAISPTAAIAVVFSPSTVTPQPNGGTQDTEVTLVATRNTAGTYTLTITGASATPSRTHQLILSVRVSPCLIATATFGSELAPEVQFLRDFRDQQITNTFAGSNFMTVFNAWYYSFSPAVAGYEDSHTAVRTAARLALYPLIGVLHLASSTYASLGFEPELAALTGGLVASFLIGLVYLAPPMIPVLWINRNRIQARTKNRITKIVMVTLFVLIAGFVVSETLVLPALMMLVSLGIVLTGITAGSVLPALHIIKHIRK